MGKRTIVEIIDDLTGKPIPESDVIEATLALTVRGTTEAWELCLAEASYKTVQETLAKLTENATEVDLVARVNHGRSPKSEENAKVREWWGGLNRAQLATLDLPEPPPQGKGRIPGAVVKAYGDAHPSEAKQDA